MTKISGSCLCGSVSYCGDVTIKMTMNCHCTDCRKVTGAAYGTLLFMMEDELTITGDLQSYHHKSDRGSDLTKLFCGTCGSQMFTKNSARPGGIGVRAGHIDQTDVVKPGANLFNDSAIPSTKMDPDLPLHARLPG